MTNQDLKSLGTGTIIEHLKGRLDELHNDRKLLELELEETLADIEKASTDYTKVEYVDLYQIQHSLIERLTKTIEFLDSI